MQKNIFIYFFFYFSEINGQIRTSSFTDRKIPVKLVEQRTAKDEEDGSGEVIAHNEPEKIKVGLIFISKYRKCNESKKQKLGAFRAPNSN